MTLSLVGFPPARVRAGIDRTKGAIKERVRRFVLSPDHFDPSGSAFSAAELERLEGQLAVIRQQHGAARTRITQLEQVNADVVHLIQETIARLRMLDVKQAESFEALRSALQRADERDGSEAGPKSDPIRRVAASGR